MGDAAKVARLTAQCWETKQKGGMMDRIRAQVRRFIGDESGIAVTEYGLLIALVAVLLIGVVTIFGESISSWFANKTNKITSF
jgi:pilus assembly protein Flp/PilA